MISDANMKFMEVDGLGLERVSLDSVSDSDAIGRTSFSNSCLQDDASETNTGNNKSDQPTTHFDAWFRQRNDRFRGNRKRIFQKKFCRNFDQISAKVHGEPLFLIKLKCSVAKIPSFQIRCCLRSNIYKPSRHVRLCLFDPSSENKFCYDFSLYLLPFSPKSCS